MILKDKIQVDSLKAGAIAYGGATEFQSGKVFSYTKEASRIICTGEADVVLYIPIISGITEETARMVAILVAMNNGFLKGDFTVERAKGSWLKKEDDSVYLDRLLLIKFKSDYSKINNLIKVSEELKVIFNQEAFSFEFNEYMVVV